MNDPGYKRLFSRPAMIRDLLAGFAARGWSDTLDFGSLNALPASYVSRDLHQRHSDLVWRIRFQDDGGSTSSSFWSSSPPSTNGWRSAC